MYLTCASTVKQPTQLGLNEFAVAVCNTAFISLAVVLMSMKNNTPGLKTEITFRIKPMS